jgi:hypothetical protein
LLRPAEVGINQENGEEGEEEEEMKMNDTGRRPYLQRRVYYVQGQSIQRFEPLNRFLFNR